MSIQFAGIIHVKGTKDTVESRLSHWKDKIWANKASSDKVFHLSYTTSAIEEEQQTLSRKVTIPDIFSGGGPQVLKDEQIVKDTSEGVLLYGKHLIDFAKREYGITIPSILNKGLKLSEERAKKIFEDLNALSEHCQGDVSDKQEWENLEKVVPEMRDVLRQLTKFSEVTENDENFNGKVFAYYHQKKGHGPVGLLNGLLGRLKLGSLKIERHKTIDLK